MNLRPGDVVLARIEFHQITGSKVRPAVVVLDTGDDDFIAAPVTSRPRHSDHDLPISDWQQAGLNAASTARVHKAGVLPKSDILRHLGRLQGADLARFLETLCRAYCHKSRSA